MRITLIACVTLLLMACGSDEPESYGGIPKDTLEQVSKDVEEAAEEAQDKIDEALDRME